MISIKNLAILGLILSASLISAGPKGQILRVQKPNDLRLPYVGAFAMASLTGGGIYLGKHMYTAALAARACADQYEPSIRSLNKQIREFKPLPAHPIFHGQHDEVRYDNAVQKRKLQVDGKLLQLSQAKEKIVSEKGYYNRIANQLCIHIKQTVRPLLSVGCAATASFALWAYQTFTSK